MIIKPRSVGALNELIIKSGRVVLKKPSTRSAKIETKPTIDDFIVTMKIEPSVRARRSKEQFLDALAETYPEQAVKAGMDNTTLTRFVVKPGETELVSMMKRWNELTGSFKTVDATAAYIHLFARHNRSKDKGIGSIAKDFGALSTHDYKAFLASNHGRSGGKEFILNFAAVSVFCAAVRQEYFHGRAMAKTLQADAYLNSACLREFGNIIAKIVRSRDLKAILVDAVGEELVSNIHKGFCLSTGDKKDNMAAAEAFIVACSRPVKSVMDEEDDGYEEDEGDDYQMSYVKEVSRHGI